MRRKCRYLDKEVVSTKQELKYKAPHCDCVNKSWCFSTCDPMWQLGMKKDTERENKSRNLDEIWMKLVEINFFWRFRFSISTSAFGNLGFNYPISHSSKSLQTGWGLWLSEFGNLGLATISFYLFSQSMEFYYDYLIICELFEIVGLVIPWVVLFYLHKRMRFVC